MRRPLAALTLSLALTALAGCGDSGEPEADKTAGPGMSVTENVATTTEFFDAIASNDPAKLNAALELVAPGSPAQAYLRLLQEDLATGPADTVTVNNGRYKICQAEAPKTCHTYGAIVLADGKVNDFTVDGKKIRIR